MVLMKKGLATAMNARIVGSGDESVVLAHGFGTDQSVWDKVVPCLARRSRVLVFDWSFSGAVKDQSLFDPDKHSSYGAFATDLIGLLDEMDFKSSIFVGHSMSGMIGCIASVDRPDLFKALVLVGASPRYLNGEDYEGGFGRPDIEQIITSIETSYDKWASYFASMVVDGKDPLSVDKLGKCLARMRPQVALPLAKTVFYCDHREALDKVTTPCTIVQTADDVVVPDSVAYYMQARIKARSTVEIIDTTCGHFPQLTAHLDLLRVLGRVLQLELS